MKENSLGNTTIVFIISVALLFDAVQALISLIPVAGEILSMLISVFAFLTFYLWFKLNGIDFTTPKRALALGGGFVIEMIPIIDMLPAWTAAVVIIIGTTKIKEVAAKHPIMTKMAVGAGQKIKAINPNQKTPHVSGIDNEDAGSKEFASRNPYFANKINKLGKKVKEKYNIEDYPENNPTPK